MIIASPVIEIPFKAFNSMFIGEPESERDRMWSLNLGNICFRSIPNVTNDQGDEIDEYERFNLSID